MFAVKSVKQPFSPDPELVSMMGIFKDMVNHCIRIGLENNCSTMKKLSLLSYSKLKEYSIQSKYKLTAISQAAGRLAQMKHDIRKCRKVKSPFVSKPYTLFHAMASRSTECSCHYQSRTGNLQTSSGKIVGVSP